MNKLLVVTVLVALLAVSAEGFRVLRQAAEEQGTLSKITNFFRSSYDKAVSTASSYVESIKSLEIEDKLQNLYTDTKTAVVTYAAILQDQLYHTFYVQQ